MNTTTPRAESDAAVKPSAHDVRSPSPSAAKPPGRCCETGRPVFTDPSTGQSICSCQHDQMMNYHRLAQASLISHSAIPIPMFNSSYGESIPPSAYIPPAGLDPSHFYSNLPGVELKDGMAPGAPWPYGYPYPYDPAMNPYGFNSYGMEINGARRKNATRETTSVLKAWLNEHKKNPYPTKGEKIMLAIITKMTLTQVSTWFANARRRLKKENKMTWEPKNRVDDDSMAADVDDDDDDDPGKDGHDRDLLDLKDDSISSNDDDEPHALRQDASSYSDELGPASSSFSHFQDPRFIDGDRSNATQTATGNMKTSLSNKPRIWSLADMANKEDKDNKRPYSLSHKYYPTIERQPLFNSQLQYPISIKPDRAAFDMYPHMNYPGKMYGTAPKEYTLIESYHRALAAHNNMQAEGQAFVLSPNHMNKFERTIDRGGDPSQAALQYISAGSKDSQSPNIDANRIDIDLNKREINSQ